MLNDWVKLVIDAVEGGKVQLRDYHRSCLMGTFAAARMVDIVEDRHQYYPANDCKSHGWARWSDISVRDARWVYKGVLIVF